MNLGRETLDAAHPEYWRFDLAAKLFPLDHTLRMGPAFVTARYAPDPKQKALEKALESDPFATDLLYHLARTALKNGNEAAYKAAIKRLKQLTPGTEYRPIQITRSDEHG